ncbi:hypothetical protein C8R44DRAFT_753112 [Mycena epipterygia]|nr:hypothetical protein C8R44DRAFT_753112 [Mycena epipterygia]
MSSKGYPNQNLRHQLPKTSHQDPGTSDHHHHLSNAEEFPGTTEMCHKVKTGQKDDWQMPVSAFELKYAIFNHPNDEVVFLKCIPSCCGGIGKLRDRRRFIFCSFAQKRRYQDPGKLSRFRYPLMSREEKQVGTKRWENTWGPRQSIIQGQIGPDAGRLSILETGVCFKCNFDGSQALSRYVKII